jgi:hypothetical protein
LLEEGDSSEHDNEPGVSIKDVEFLAQLTDRYILKKDYA